MYSERNPVILPSLPNNSFFCLLIWPCSLCRDYASLPKYKVYPQIYWPFSPVLVWPENNRRDGVKPQPWIVLSLFFLPTQTFLYETQVVLGRHVMETVAMETGPGLFTRQEKACLELTIRYFRLTCLLNRQLVVREVPSVQNCYETWEVGAIFSYAGNNAAIPPPPITQSIVSCYFLHIFTLGYGTANCFSSV